MGIPAGVQRLTFTGHGSDGEIWTNSHWWRSSVIGDLGPTTNAQAAAMLTAILTNAKATTYRTFLMGKMPATCGIDKATLYCYPAGGPTSPAISEQAWVAVGTNGVGPLIPQACQVASLRTGQSGRSYRGRVYLPVQSSVLSGGHQYAAADCTAVANAVAAFLSGWGLLAITPAGNGIFASVISSTLGAANSISQVIVDSRPDVQRRRANRATIESVAQTAVTG